MRIQQVAFPGSSILAQAPYDYADSFQGTFSNADKQIDTLDVGKALFSTAPKWVGTLLALRNKLVSIFGLKTGDGAESPAEAMARFTGAKGERIGLFKVFERTDHEMVLGEDDTHLDFRVSVLLPPADVPEKELILTTTVTYNNAFGKFYFFIVKPFHKLIVPQMMKGILKEIGESDRE